MVDIYGRSRITKEKKTGVDMEEIIKKIKDEISGLINTKDIDPKEIVVFENEYGKLKTSNVSLDDLLTKDPTADDDSIVVFKDGKLAPSVIMSSITEKFTEFEQFLSDFLGGPRQPVIQIAYIKAAIDSLTRLRTEYDAHINQFLSLRRNFNAADAAIEKFFDKKNPTVDDIKTTLPSIIDTQQKTINDIDSVTNTINNNYIQLTAAATKITRIEKEINDVKSGIPAIAEQMNKIKIVFPESRIKQIVQVVDIDNFDYVSGPNLTVAKLFFIDKLEIGVEISGIYRFSVISSKQFNIEARTGTVFSATNPGTGVLLGKGIDTITFSILNANLVINISTVDGKQENVKCTTVLEYLGRK